MGVAQSFPPDVGKLYCFTKVKGANGESYIKHQWYYGEKRMASVRLKVDSGVWRTFSSKNVLPTWTGDWKVVITTDSGEVLKTIEFKIQ